MTTTRSSYLPTFHQPSLHQRVSYATSKRPSYARGLAPTYAPRVPTTLREAGAVVVQNEQAPVVSVSLAA